ncbi:hypothetical protein J6590_017266 [Homalodisca vitripennis]|nr:hypothetical protein J6590_017266 [Homalodisca vitripennis]
MRCVGSTGVRGMVRASMLCRKNLCAVYRPFMFCLKRPLDDISSNHVVLKKTTGRYINHACSVVKISVQYIVLSCSVVKDRWTIYRPTIPLDDVPSNRVVLKKTTRRYITHACCVVKTSVQYIVLSCSVVKDRWTIHHLIMICRKRPLDDISSIQVFCY